MGKIESFSQEGQLLNRIEHYKQKGLAEDRLTVISNEGLGDTLIDYPNVTHKTAEGDAWDKIAAWIAGEDPENQVMDKLHLDDEEREVYRKSLANGKMLLFIDYSNQEIYSNRKTNTREDTAGNKDTVRHTNKVTSRGHGTDNGNAIRPTNKVTSSDEDNITLREERLVVDKDNVNLGEVVVNKYTDSEVEEFDVPVERDNVTVDRRPVEGEPLFETYNHDDSDDDMGVIRIPITKERIKIIKEQVVTEEIIIRKEKIKDTKHISEVVSHEDVEVTEVKKDVDDSDNRKDQY